MLKRHLMTHYGMTPDQYRQKWGLAADYPMVAPNYAEQRRTLAKSIGLGTKRKRTAQVTSSRESKRQSSQVSWIAHSRSRTFDRAPSHA